MADCRFPKRMRLLRASEFERVFAARASAADPWIVLYGATNDLDCPRLGLTVSRRIGGAAARNRWKRLLREAFRLAKDRLPPLDLVCVPRAQIPPQLGHLTEALPSLAARIDSKLQGSPRPSIKKAP